MAHRKITIEIQTDFRDDLKDKIMLKLIREAARDLITRSSLIQDDVQPKIAVSSRDFFSPAAEIMLTDPDEDVELHPPQTDEEEATADAYRDAIADEVERDSMGNRIDGLGEMEGPDYDADGNRIIKPGEFFIPSV